MYVILVIIAFSVTTFYCEPPYILNKKIKHEIIWWTKSASLKLLLFFTNFLVPVWMHYLESKHWRISAYLKSRWTCCSLFSSFTRTTLGKEEYHSWFSIPPNNPFLRSFVLSGNNFLFLDMKLSKTLKGQHQSMQY